MKGVHFIIAAGPISLLSLSILVPLLICRQSRGGSGAFQSPDSALFISNSRESGNVPDYFNLSQQGRATSGRRLALPAFYFLYKELFMAISKLREYLGGGRDGMCFDGDDLDNFGALAEIPSVTSDAAAQVDKVGRLCKLWTDAQADGDEIAAGKIFDLLQKLLRG
jgi:hypothetical protein